MLSSRELAEWRALEPVPAGSVDAALGPMASSVANELVALSGASPSGSTRLGSPNRGREMLTRAAGLYHEVGNANGAAHVLAFLGEYG